MKKCDSCNAYVDKRYKITLEVRYEESGITQQFNDLNGWNYFCYPCIVKAIKQLEDMRFKV